MSIDVDGSTVSRVGRGGGGAILWAISGSVEDVVSVLPRPYEALSSRVSNTRLWET